MSSISKTGSHFDSQTVKGIQINTQRSNGVDGRLLPNLPFGSEPAYTVEISAAGMAAYLKSVRDKKAKAELEAQAKARTTGSLATVRKNPQAEKQLDLRLLSMTDILGLVAKGTITSQQAADELQSRQGKI